MTDKIEDDFKEALKINYRYKQAVYQYGLHLRKIRRDGAIILFKKAIEFYPEFSAAVNSLAFVCFDNMCDDDALKLLIKALEIEP